MKERLSAAEAAIVLGRAAELRAARKSGSGEPLISSEELAGFASALGVFEEDLRLALADFHHEKVADPDSLARRVYGASRMRVVREIERPEQEVRERLEGMLRKEQGLKLRGRARVSSLWDPGDLLGAIRRAMDFSGSRPLLKAKSVELRVESIGAGRCRASLRADVSNQRGEYLSLGGILGATLAIPLAIAGAYEWLYFLAIPPALAVPGLGFRFAYGKACADIRRALDELLEASEQDAPETDEEREDPRSPIRIQRPGSIRKYTPESRREE